MEIWPIDKKLPIVTCSLIGIQFLVFLVLEFAGSTEDGYFMLLHGALYAPSVWQDGEYYRLLTAAFLHFGAAHLMNNMLMLYLIGVRLEDTVGKWRFLVIYLLSAVGANAFTAVFYSLTGEDAISAGASGAILGLIGALFGILLRSRRSVAGMDRRQMLILIFLTVYSGFVSSSTNNAAHISGLIFGFLLGLLLCPANVRKRK